MPLVASVSISPATDCKSVRLFFVLTVFTTCTCIHCVYVPLQYVLFFVPLWMQLYLTERGVLSCLQMPYAILSDIQLFSLFFLHTIHLRTLHD